ncbi:MAG TPA: ABC transporter substrate-binding protein [Pseudolabrys sp.]|jgi:ABC-type nitrate/sulfonate/bicarbonate transport system substrate-binding protein|nr:ABC transporter substrate-binding protein [Pseudolabrys sp.]HVU21895.1 ABC transporter substrate-binding protein [Rhizomicrobium sp.]
MGNLNLKLVALAGALILASSPTTAWAEQKVPLRVAYTGVITWLPAMIAKENGIFDKNGLDVTMTRFTQIANLPGTLGKQFDLAPTTAPDMLNAVASGINLAAAIGNTYESSEKKSYEVLVRADSPIKSPKDLQGKRIAGPGVGSVMHVALIDWVKKDGGDPSGIKGVEVPFPNMADQLKAGRVDAVEQLQPFVGAMKAAGFRSLGDPLLGISDPVLFTFWIADADWARGHQDVLRKFRTSLQGGLAIIKSDPKAARAVLSKYTGLPERVVAKIPFPGYDFSLTSQQLVVWQKLMVGQHQPVDKLDMNKLVAAPE